MYKVILVGVSLCLCTSILKITEPLSNPFPNSEIGYNIGNFGDIPYGKTITGELELY